mgnify:CR=1 FL=1
MLKVHFLIFFLIFFKSSVSFSQIQIKYKIGEEIITNVDILNERKYLIFLRPGLKELPESEITKISTNSSFCNKFLTISLSVEIGDICI